MHDTFYTIRSNKKYDIAIAESIRELKVCAMFITL